MSRCKMRRADFVRDGEAQAVFEASTHESAFVHEDGFQVAHQRGINVQFLAQAVHRYEIEVKIEFGKVAMVVTAAPRPPSSAILSRSRASLRQNTSATESAAWAIFSIR